MSDNNKEISAASEEFEAFLPEGWAEGDNIFDVDSWTGGTDQADESDADDGQEADTEADNGSDDAGATRTNDDAGESGEDGDNAPANEQETERPKLRFSAQIDHKMEDVELDENDLPTIYQKAHVTDRMKERLGKAQPIIDKGNRLAKILGYDSIDAMLDAAEDSYRQGEIERLTGEGVHPDVAKELVETRTSRAVADKAEQAQADDDVETPETRNYEAEVADLLKVHPELRGTTLPESVVNDCVVNKRPLVSAYESYARKQAEAENKAVKAENKRLKQNADAARRAPVRGVSKGGKTNTDPDDPFLAGFNSYNNWS